MCTDSVIDMGSDDKAFLAAVYSVSDGDDVTRLQIINQIPFHRTIRV